MASFKLCYYGNGCDVTIPLAWIIKLEREVEGNTAQWTWLLCSPHIEKEPKGRNTSFCNWFCLGLVLFCFVLFFGQISLPAGAVKEAQDIGAKKDLLKWQEVAKQLEQSVGVRLGVLILFIYLFNLLGCPWLINYIGFRCTIL